MPVGAIPFPFGKCKICKDKATGVHYGVATCEGCKGFFKRSIPRADKYKCFFGGQCEITPKNRNRCKACRFKLCIQFGMSVDAVKMGRIPKTEKDRALAEARDQDSENGQKEYSHQQSSNYQPVLNSIPQQNELVSHSIEEMHAVNPFMDTHVAQNMPSVVLSHSPDNVANVTNNSNLCNIPSINQLFKDRPPLTLGLKNNLGGNFIPPLPNFHLEKKVSDHKNSDTSNINSRICGIDEGIEDSRRSYFGEGSNEAQDGWSSWRQNAMYFDRESPSFSGHRSTSVSDSSLDSFHDNQKASSPPQSTMKNLKSHFSTAVIDELVRQVFESSPNGNCSIENSDTNSSEISDIHSNSKSDTINHKKEGCEALNNQNVESLKSVVNSKIMDKSEKHVNISPSLETQTVEKDEVSLNVIDATLERMKEMVTFLYSFQRHNQEIYRKHINGEFMYPFTGTEKNQLEYIYKELMGGVEHSNSQIIGFCSKVPGFSNLNKEDQEKLTMNAYMEIWMIVNSEFMTTDESYVLLNQKDIFYSKASMCFFLGEELTKLMLDFSKKFHQFNLSETEIGILCAIRLTNPDIEGLKEKDKVECLNSHFLDIFAAVLNKRTNSSRIAIALFQLFLVLKTITKLQQDVIFDLNVDFDDVYKAKMESLGYLKATP